MASPSLGDKDSLFEKLKSADPKDLEAKNQAINQRIQATFHQSQQRLSELIDQNSTLPTTVSSVTVLGAPNTRRSFLKGIVDPLLSANRDRPYTQSEVVNEAAAIAKKLSKFGIYHEPISIFFDKPDKADPSTTPTDLAVFYSVREKSKIFAQTGTDLGNAEGSAYANVQWRNVFGGAETLDVNAALGTRTRSAYQATFDTPFLGNPDFRFQLGGIQSSTQKAFASHEEALRGAYTKLRWLTGSGTVHEVGYNGVWRQVTGLAANASPSVRNDAGDSFKSSITYSQVKDTRDIPALPSRGYYAKSMAELAGWGPLQGDVAFLKAEVEGQSAVAIPIPGVKGESGVSFSAGVRAGMLYPLTLGTNANPEMSRINDRFQLGGPTDARGFRLSGLGPRDGQDALGGDLFAAASANLFVPLPRVGKDKPLRLHAFVNGGRLLGLSSKRTDGEMTSQDVSTSMKEKISELGDGLPSMSAGIGLVYALQAARVELNFSLPLVVRKGEEGRKGLQFGIGINYL